MGSASVIFALIAVALVLLGLWLGFLQGRKSSNGLLEQRLESEQKLAETREAGLRTQFENANIEIAVLRPKAEELTRVQEQLRNEEAKYAQMKADLDSAFKGAAADALRANTQSFLALAKQELGAQKEDAQQALAAKELAIKNLLDPLGAVLRSLDEQTRAMEIARSGAYSEVKTLVEGMQNSIPASLESLKNETAQLITALRAPKTRGNWGELQLKRCVEFAGMVQYCSFSEQVTARDEADKMLRPDMTIQLPNGREIVVDAKTPLDAFLDASGNADAATQSLRFASHAQRVKAHLKDLSGKEYWKQFKNAPEFVVCFLPSEALFSAALEADPSLIEFSARNNVVMATPTTLIALLKAIAYGWHQAKITKNAKQIQENGQRLYDKLVNAYKYVDDLRGALGNSVAHYNKFIAAIEGRDGAFEWARKLHAVEHPDDELEEIEPLQLDIRELKPEKWLQPLLVAGSDEKPGFALAAEADASAGAE